MNASQQRRLGFIAVLMTFGLGAVLYRLVTFQLLDAGTYAELGRQLHNWNVVDSPDRGIIYDRNMTVLAGNSADYRLGASPSLVLDADEVAASIAPILQLSRHELVAKLSSDQLYEVIAPRIPAAEADAVRELDLAGLQLDPLPRRIYPQDKLMCHVLGFTDLDGRGGAGLEGFFQAELAGISAQETINISPLTTQASVIATEGVDLVLTVDRTVQYVVEEHLKRALQTYGAQSGTIIVMDPRTGAILAMANQPCYDPYEFYSTDRALLLNPAVTKQYEPGSVMKLITMAAALDSGTVTPQSTYYDSGVIVLGGWPIYNWDHSARGTMDMTGLLANSLNVGAATIASWMGQEAFYTYFQRFGFGRPTGIDLMAEASGMLPLPNSENWTETNLGTNAFGQGMAVTPLQMISSVSALANDGYLMRPYLVQEKHAGGKVYVHEPEVISRPVSEQTADQMTAMAINAVRTEIFGAQVEGYTLAGKTGTAQIPENGIYHPEATIASFIGWLPADAPELIVLIKLDRPSASPWGSTTAAPTFAELATDLVALLDIPPDAIRLQGDVLAVRGN